MDNNSFIVKIKKDDIYKDTAKDVETSFDTSKQDLNRPLQKGKNKNVIGIKKSRMDLMDYEQKAKTYNYFGR